MIQVYKPGNNNFTKNGDMVLLPMVCQVSAQLNGTWTLELDCPIDNDDRWKQIEVTAVIKAPSFNGDQLFRVRQTEKKDSGIHIVAEPIFLDAVGDCFLLDVRPTKKNGQEALDMILAPNNKYSGTSDITNKNTAYYVRKNALEAIAGDDNSFLNRWGGEILYNNYEIIINKRVGGDYGVQLLYGKNIPTDGLTEAVNMDGVTTRIIPKAYNGYLLPGNSPWVDSPLINAYPTIMTKMVEFENIRLASDVSEGEEVDNLIICDTMEDLYQAMRTACQEEFDNGIDKPTVSINADMVMLSNTVEYQEFKDLERVSLGDTIHCKHNRLEIVTEARVMGLVYDCLRKAVTNVTIGQTQASFMDRVSSTVNRTEKAITKGGAVRAEQVQGFIDGVYAQLRVQNTVARRQEVRAIFFEDLDPESPTFGALAIGTQGWQISKERTADGRDWVWTTAATSSGIVADAITTGTLEAIDITGSTITGSTISTNNSAGDEAVRVGNGVIKVYWDGVLAGTIKSAERDGLLHLLLSGANGIVALGTNILANAGNSNVLIRDKDNNDKFIVMDAKEHQFLVGYQDSHKYAKLDIGDTSAKLYILAEEGKYIDLDAANQRLLLASGTDRAWYYNTYAIFQSNGTTNWQSHFRAGNTLSYGVATFAGHIANSSKRLIFFMPLNGSPQGRTATITLPNNWTVRGVNGYVGGSQFPTWNVTATVTCVRNGVLVQLDSSTAFTNATTNTPVTVEGNFTLTFA